jgi:hypothetical protein
MICVCVPDKTLDAALLIPLLLPLAISLERPRVSLSVLLLVVRMFIPPLPLGFANDLALHGIGHQLLAVVVGSSLALTSRLGSLGITPSCRAKASSGSDRGFGRGV